MIYTLGPNDITDPDALVGKIKAGDTIQLAAGASGELSKTIQLAPHVKVAKVGSGDPYTFVGKTANMTVFSIGPKISDVEIHSVAANLFVTGSPPLEAVIVSIAGSNVRLYDIRAYGRAELFRFAGCRDVTIDGFFARSGAIYPIGYGNSVLDGPIPTNVTIKNGTLISTGEDRRTHGTRFSRGAGITLQNIDMSVEKDAQGHYRLVNDGFDLKTPGPFFVKNVTTRGFPTNKIGPLADGDGSRSPGWQNVRTSKVRIEEPHFLDCSQYALNVMAGIDSVEVVGGELSGGMCGINVQPDYYGHHYDAAGKDLGPNPPDPSKPHRLASHGTLTQSTIIHAPVRIKGGAGRFTEV